MIQRILIEKRTMHFREPFKIAYETVTEAEVVVLALVDELGNTGLGSAAPDEEVTGENNDAIYKAVKARLSPDFFSIPFEDLPSYSKKIRELFPRLPSAQAMVETALLHLSAKRQKHAPQEFFGKFRESVKIVVTIGIKSLPETVNEVDRRIKEGFETIKLKCGLDPESDIKKILAVRKAMPSSTRLLLDANQGYSFKQAETVLRAVSHLGIAGMEQPVKASHKEELKKLTDLKLISIIADEAAITAEEARFLLSRDYADGINIKLMKFGGPFASKEIIELALKKSKLVMLGCMYESNASITAAAYLALAYPVDFVDLDSGHLDFDDDPSLFGAVVKNGNLKIKGIPEWKELAAVSSPSSFRPKESARKT
ncbi:MAG: enolase C-terminal domain-like protein [Acidobacteriaceae bacterium]